MAPEAAQRAGGEARRAGAPTAHQQLDGHACESESGGGKEAGLGEDQAFVRGETFILE